MNPVQKTHRSFLRRKFDALRWSCMKSYAHFSLLTLYWRTINVQGSKHSSFHNKHIATHNKPALLIQRRWLCFFSMWQDAFLALHASICGVPKYWRHRPRRPRSTWLQTLEADLQPTTDWTQHGDLLRIEDNGGSLWKGACPQWWWWTHNEGSCMLIVSWGEACYGFTGGRPAIARGRNS